MDPVLQTLDAAVRALDDVDAVLPALRWQVRALAEATSWDCATMRRYRHRLDDWDDDIARLAARLADDCEGLRGARAARAAALAGVGGGR